MPKQSGLCFWLFLGGGRFCCRRSNCGIGAEWARRARETEKPGESVEFKREAWQIQMWSLEEGLRVRGGLGGLGLSSLCSGCHSSRKQTQEETT